ADKTPSPTPATTAAAPAAPTIPTVTAATPGVELPGLVPVPLASIVVPAENGSWLKDPDYILVPHLETDFGGIPFLMDGMLQLQSQYAKDVKNRSYRADISAPLPVTALVGSVHLLGGTRYGDQQQEFAQMVWHYNDGTTAKTPIVNQLHFRDWVRNPYEQPAHLPYRFSKV